jgi:hypothetical protein
VIAERQDGPADTAAVVVLDFEGTNSQQAGALLISLLNSLHANGKLIFVCRTGWSGCSLCPGGRYQSTQAGLGCPPCQSGTFASGAGNTHC